MSNLKYTKTRARVATFRPRERDRERSNNKIKNNNIQKIIRRICLVAFKSLLINIVKKKKKQRVLKIGEKAKAFHLLT